MTSLDTFSGKILAQKSYELPTPTHPNEDPPLRLTDGDHPLLMLERHPRGPHDRGAPAAELLAELEAHPNDVPPGTPLRIRRAIYQTGHDTLLYRSETFEGALTVLAHSGTHTTLQANLTFTHPTVHRDDQDATVLVTGRVVVEA